jgi:hypothetical protein
LDIPPEIIAAKNELEIPLLENGLITGIDFGVHDEEQPDPEDLVLRIFVADATAVPPEVTAAADAFPFPVIVLQRTFEAMQATTLPDTARYRPVVGGVSVAASRFASTSGPTGTLGAIVRDNFNPDTRYGLSNFHVMCADSSYQMGDEISQPEPIFGLVKRIGALGSWAYPETTQEGLVDAALCTLEVASLDEIAEVGSVSGSAAASPGMMVSKRGRTTGLTFGIVTGTRGSYPQDASQLPTVTTSAGVSTTVRILKNQIQIRADFPQFIVFGDRGDSGSAVLGPANRVVGLYWGSGHNTPGDPLTFGVACPADAVESELSIAF